VINNRTRRSGLKCTENVVHARAKITLAVKGRLLFECRFIVVSAGQFSRRTNKRHHL